MMKVLRRFNRNVRDAFKSVIRNFSLSIASISCITITLIVVSTSIIMSFNVDNFTNSINQNIEVVLFHDYNKITLSILPDAIKYLKDNNYILLPLFYESNMINK